MKKILFFLFSLTFVACASKQAHSDLYLKTQLKKANQPQILVAPANAPSWTKKSHFKSKNNDYFVASGVALTEDDAKNKAFSNVTDNISKFISVSVKSQLKNYQENFAGKEGGIVVNASTQTGASVNLQNYNEEVYLTKSEDASGTTIYNAYVKIEIPQKQMELLKVDAQNKNAWKVLVQGCENKDEFIQLFKNIASQKEWFLELKQTKKEIQQLSENPKDEFLAVLDVKCSENKISVSLSRFNLLKKVSIFSISAKGQNFDEMKKNLFKQLFLYKPATFLTPFPEVKIKSKLSNVNIDLLRKYNEAVKSDNFGRLFPQIAIQKWSDLQNIETANPYKNLAKNRVEIWKKYVAEKTAMENSKIKDFAKLNEILKMEAIPKEQKADFLRDFINKYASFYGFSDIDKIFASYPDLKSKVYSPQLISEWKNACKKRDYKACFFLANSSKKDLKKLSFACQNNVEPACSQLFYLLKSSNLKKAMNFGEKSCKLGNKKLCFPAGSLAYKIRKMNDAKEFLKIACDLNSVGGCAYLGFMYEHGESVKKDLQKAKEFYQKACNLGYEKSCKKLNSKPKSKTNSNFHGL